MRRLRSGKAAGAVLLILVSGCYGIRVTVHVPPSAPYRKVARPGIVGDDLDLEGLRRAAQASQRYFAGVRGSKRSFALGYDTYSVEQLARSVDFFLELIERTPRRELNRRLARECRAYRSAGGARFTAYYEPVLSGRRKPDGRFRYPLYQKPDELTLVRLARFFPGDPRQFHGQVRGGELLPYLTREEIDGKGRLRGRGLELAWVDDPVALYFLHIQGSGRLLLDDGEVLRVNYAASNGLPYTSVGRYMLDHGLLGPSHGSAGAMRAYLDAHPAGRDSILFQNRRYIFFRKVRLSEREGPVGSLGVPLVAGRSIATDHRYVPPGVVTYIRAAKPLINAQGDFLGWQKFSRFAFNHDSGAAIKGPQRADIYWGEGEKAGVAAGYMNRPGSLVVLICGVEPGQTVAATSRPRGFQSVAWPGLKRAAGSSPSAGL